MTRLRFRLLLGTIMSGCALAATPSSAQNAFQGTPTVVTGIASITQGLTPNTDQIGINSTQVVINWLPNDVKIGGGAIDFLPVGSTALFAPAATKLAGAPTNYTVFNRILPVDPTRAVQFNGTVQSRLQTIGFSGQPTLTPGGTVWFYSPGGIIAGPTAVFDIGSLVLTSNDIDTTGGLLGPGGQIRFRGAAGGLSAVSIAAGAQIKSTVAGSYVALVAPRVVQAGTINVTGSTALVAAEQADVTINNGLFDIAFLVGTSDANGVVHSGTTGGPAATATDPNHGVYLAAMPKNTAITMLVGGNLGFGAVSAGVVNNAVVLSSGVDLVAGAPAGTAATPTALGTININANITGAATLFSSGVLARSTGTVIADPNVVGGSITFAGPAILAGDVAASVNASQGSTIVAQGNLSLDASSLVGAGGNTSLSATFNPGLAGTQSRVTVAGNLLLNSSATAKGTPSLGGNATISDNNGVISVAGATTLMTDAIGFSALDNNGDGTGGRAMITTNGAQSSLLFNADVLVSANGVGGTSAPNLGVPLLAGAGNGGTAQFSNGGGTVTFANKANLSLSASGLGGIGHMGNALTAAGTGGTGTGGLAAANFARGQTNFNAIAVSATGIGGAGAPGGNFGPPGIGGSGVGGQASLIVPANGGTATGTSATLTASGIGGLGSFSTIANSGSAGGSGRGGVFNVLIAGGAFTTTLGFAANADGVGGDAGGTNGVANVGGVGGSGIGGAGLVTLSGGLFSVGGATLSAGAFGGNGGFGRGNGGAGGAASGGALTLTDSGGNNALGAISFSSTAVGGAGGGAVTGSGGGGGDAVGGSGAIAFTATETIGSLVIDASLAGGAGGTGGLNGAGGAGGGAQSKGAVQVSATNATVTIGGVTLVSQANGGLGGNGVTAAGNGGNAQAGTSQILANSGATIITTGLTINASALGGGGGSGFASNFTAGAGGAGGNGIGGTAALILNSGAVTLNTNAPFADTLVASGAGGAGGLGGIGTCDCSGTIDNGVGGAGGAGGGGTGGNATVRLSGATAALALNNPLIVSAAGIGGLGSDGGANGKLATTAAGSFGGNGGAGNGGSSLFTVLGGNVNGVVTVTLDAHGQAGNGGVGTIGAVGGTGGNGGDATGGTAALVVDPSVFKVDTLMLDASATSGTGGVGGNGSTTAAGIIDVTTPQAGNGGQGGNGGNATGGSAVTQVIGSALMSATTTLDASGNGGDAGLGGVALANMINTGAPGTLTANYLNGLALAGVAKGGSAKIALSDGPANTVSNASLGDTAIDVSGNGGNVYRATATLNNGVVQDFASFTSSPFGQVGGRADVSYMSAIGGGGLQFTNLNVNAFGLDDGSLIGGGVRGIYIANQTDPLIVTGATTLSAPFFGHIGIAIGGTGTFRAGDLNAQAGDITVSYAPQGAPATTRAIDATSIVMNATNTINAAPTTLITSAGDTMLTTTNGAISFGTIGAGGNATINALNSSISGTTLTANNAFVGNELGGGNVTVTNLTTLGSAIIGTNFINGAIALGTSTLGSFIEARAASIVAGTTTAGTDAIFTSNNGNLQVGNIVAGDDIWLSLFSPNPAFTLTAGSLRSTGLGNDTLASGPRTFVGTPNNAGPVGNVIRVRGPGQVTTGAISSPDRAILVSDLGALTTGDVTATQGIALLGRTGVTSGALNTSGALVIEDSSVFLPNLPTNSLYQPSTLLGLPAVALNGPITISGAVASGSTLITTTGSLATSALNVSAGNNATLSADAGLALGAATFGGNAILTASNGALAANTLNVAGIATLSGSTGVTLGAATFSNGSQITSANGALNATTLVVTNGGALLSGATGIQFGTATVNGNAQFNSTNGMVTGNALNVTGGNARIDSATGITLATTAIGNFATFTSNGPVTVTKDFGVGGSASVRGSTVSLQSLGALTLSGAHASAGAVTITTGGLLSVLGGLVDGQTVSLTSPDIAIDTGEGQVGRSGFTTNVTLTSTSTRGTFIGDTGATTGYLLSNAEAQRIFGTNISFVAPRVGNSTGLTATPDLTIGTLTLAANGANIGVGGALSFTTPGTVRVSGALTLNNDPGNAINITAGNAIVINAATGSININDGKGGLAGAINLTAPDIIAASPTVLTAVNAATTGQALNDALSANDGAVNNTGYLSANAISFTIRNGVYIQNSGADTAKNSNYAARRGFTVGAGGLTISTAGINTRIFINGRQAATTATGAGFVTGLDFIPTIKIGAQTAATGPIAGQALFDKLSTVNGCLITAVDACRTSFTDGTLSTTTLDKVGEMFGFGPTPYTTLIQLKDVVPLGDQPLIDDPVTGAGNDDLWAAQDMKKKK